MQQIHGLKTHFADRYRLLVATRLSIRALFPIALLVICLSGLTAIAQQRPLFNDPAFLKVAPSAVDSVYNLNFESGRKQLEPWRKSHQDHPLWLFWDGLELWWKIVPDLEQTTYDDAFFYTFGRTDYACTRLLAKEPLHLDALLLKALSNGFMARLHANRDNWLQSLRYGKAASDALSLVELHYPEIVDARFGRGLYLYYAEALPEKYNFMRTVSWMFPEGSKTQGLAMLRDAAEKSTFLRAESTYFLGNILLNYEQKPDAALIYHEKLHNQYPENAFFTRLYARGHFNRSSNDQALGIMDGLLQTLKPNSPVTLAEELNLLKGRLLLQQGRLREARTSIELTRSFAKKASGGTTRSQQVIATYYLAEIESKEGNTDRAKDLYRTVIKAKNPEWVITTAKDRLKQL